MALRIALQKKLNKSRNQSELPGSETFTASVRNTRSQSRSKPTVHKESFVSPKRHVESHDNSSGAVETSATKTVTQNKMGPIHSDLTGSTPDPKFCLPSPSAEFLGNKQSEPVLQLTKKSHSILARAPCVNTPSPRGILKIFPSSVTPSPSPKPKSISFGGTFFSPTPPTPARESHKASPRLSDESSGVRNFRRKCRTAYSPSSDLRTPEDSRKNDYEEPLKIGPSPRRRNKRVNNNPLDTSTCSQLSPMVSINTSIKAYPTKRALSGGCSCKGHCNPSTCSCAQNEIFCMVSQKLSQRRE